MSQEQLNADLMLGCTKSNAIAGVVYLIEKGANVNIANENGYSPLHLAASGERSAVAQYLVNKGANINAENEFGRTPLWIAAYNEQANMVKLLIENGAKSLPSYLGFTETIKALLETSEYHQDSVLKAGSATKYQGVLNAFKNKGTEEGFSEILDEFKTVFTKSYNDQFFTASYKNQKHVKQLFDIFVEITGIREDADVKELLCDKNNEALDIEEALLINSMFDNFQVPDSIPGMLAQEASEL